VNRLTILAEDDSAEDSVEKIGSSSKIIGEGTCKGFNRGRIAKSIG